MIVDINYIYYIKKVLNEVNSVSLEDIEFYEQGVRLDIPQRNIEDFELTGLNNIDFITSNYYKKEREND